MTLRSPPCTVKESEGLPEEASREPGGTPGLVLCYSDTRAYLLPIPLRGGRLELGRDELQALHIEDSRTSRHHLAAEQEGAKVKILDLGSTNGVFVNGERLRESVTVERAVVLMGRTLLLVVPDLAPFQAALDRPLVQDGIVVGPTLHSVHQQVAALARSEQGLFLRGESGCGKEITARLYHQAGRRRGGPFVGVNCAAIPKDLAERLLFGAVRGAYSGAVSDAVGYLQAAHGGTLFLDEVAELDTLVQAKLLRALESREVVPLGATRPQTIDIGLCAATLRDLREAVSRGTFREDLYYRIGRPEVRVPALRDRPEEIPFFAQQAARATSELAVAVLLVEACLLRPWPGNIRELFAEVRAATALALAEGGTQVQPKHLATQAGLRIEPRPAGSAPPEAEPPTRPEEDARSVPAADGVSLPEATLRAASEALGLAHKTVLKLLPAHALQQLHRGAERDGLAAAERASRVRAQAAECLRTLLLAHDYSQSEVATTLGTSRTTLIKLMDELHVPRATELAAADIARALAECQGDVEDAARRLQVSSTALRKRLTTRGAS